MTPERKQRGDKVLKNSGRGLQSLYKQVSRAVLAFPEREKILFQVMQEPLLSHQGRQRKNVA